MGRFFNKKSQFLVLSTLLLSLLLVFIYSIETENFYMVEKGEFSILENIQFQSCRTGQLSNGSLIDSRFLNLSLEVFNYCNDLNYNCNLSIDKQVGAPINLSLLNYTHFDYSINFSGNNYKFVGNFTC